MKRIILIILLIAGNTDLFSFPFDTTPSQTGEFARGKKVFADFDMDGDLDVATVFPLGGEPFYGFIMNNYNGVLQGGSFFGFGSGKTANAIAVGDVDNDGFMDLAMNITNDRLIILRNNYGGFDANNPSYFITNNKNIQDILFADFNNDKNLDLAVANYSNNNWIFQGNGDGTFSLTPNLVIPGTNCTFAIASGDLNKDGNLDIVTANAANSNIIYFLDGNFGIAGKVSDSQILWTTSVAVCDVNNDSWFDIIYGSSKLPSLTTNIVQIYTNSGSSFSIKQTITNIEGSAEISPLSISPADIDNDKDLDLAVVYNYLQCESAKIIIYTNENSYFNASSFQMYIDGYADFFDIDNDGDLDLFSDYIFENKSPIITANPTYKGFSADKALKFGEDSILLLSSQASQAVSIVRPESNNKSLYIQYTNRRHSDIMCGAVGDINGVLSFEDNDDFVIGTKAGWIYAYTNASTEQWGSINFVLCWSNKSIDGYAPYSMAIGDVNGDGAPDLVYSLANTNQQGGGGASDTNQGTYIMLNNNQGFNTNNKIKLPSMDFAGMKLYFPADSILIDDIDKDGDNDIIGGTGGPDFVAYNKGQGLFNELTSCYPEMGETTAIDLGDVDGDGDLDIARGNYNSFTYIYRNDNGILTSSIWNSPTMNDVSAIKFCDVDRDGDLDLGVANGGDSSSSYKSFIMKNKGSGLGTTENDYLWQSESAGKHTGIILQDFDRDNDIDIFLAAGDNFYSNKIYNGLYADNFVSEPNLPNTPTVIKQDWGTNQGIGDLTDITFNLIAFDNEGRTNKDALVRFQVSLLDGTEWKDATVWVSGSDMTQGPLPSSFWIKASAKCWTNKTVHWDALADSVQGSRFIMRIIVYPGYQNAGKISHSSYIYYMTGGFYINGRPNAMIVSPRDNAKISGKVKIIGAAYDYDFTKYVIEIKDSSNGLVLSSTNTNNPVPPVGQLYEWDTTPLTSGTYTIFLKVFDKLYPDPKSESTTVIVTNKEQNSPSIIAVYPTNNMENVPANAPVIAKFSRYMNENTLREGTMSVKDGTITLDGNIKYKNIVKCLIFDASPCLSFNRTHIGKIQAAFQDVLGNTLGNDYIWNFKVEQGLPQSIESISPLYEDVQTNTQIKVKYYTDMSGFTNINDNTFYVQDIDGNKVQGTITPFNPSNRMVIFTPTFGLKGSTLYIVTLKKEIINETVPYPFSWYFITEDTVIPQVVSTVPVNGNDFFSPNEDIRVKFNKTMNINMLQEKIFQLTDSKGNSVKGSLIYDMENNYLIFTPDTSLVGLESYTATVFSKFQDMGGHSLTADYIWNFRTTKILSSAGGELKSLDKKIKLRVPKNALTSDTAISISRLATADIPSVPADSKLKSIKQAYSFEPSGLKLNKPITITFEYPDVNNNNIVDDYETGVDFAPSIDATKLGLFYYNSSTQRYERIGGTVDTATKTLTASINHFSIFGLFEDNNTYDEDLNIDINISPRIFDLSQDSSVDIGFNLKLSINGTAEIKIYNLAGRLVKTLKEGMNVNDGSNHVEWDGKDNNGDIVHDRMYIIHITVKDQSGKSISKTKTIVVLNR